MPPSAEFFLPLSGRLYTQQQWDELEEKEPQQQQKGKQVYILESVRDVTEDEEQLTATAEDLCDQLSVSSLSILDPDNFDLLYSICRDFGRASVSLQRPTLQSVLAGLSSVRSAADQYVKAKEKKGALVPPQQHSSHDMDDGDDEQQLGGDLSTSYRSALKMYAFLLATLIHQQEKAQDNNNQSEEEMMLASKGKKKATGRGKKAVASSLNSSLFEWSSQKEKAIGALVDLLHQRSLFSLWRMSSPEEELGSALFSTAMTLLESVDNHKLKGVKDASASLFSSVLLKFPTLLPQAANQLVHALHSKGEALAAPLADLVAVASARPYKLSLLLPEILAEISELDVAMMSKDTGAARALSTFLVEVASRSPRACLAHLPQLEAHLGGESYMMRNGVVQVLGQLVEALDGLATKDKEQQADKNNKKKAKRGGAYEEDEDDSEAEEDARLAAKLSGDAAAGSAAAPHDATTVMAESKARILSMLHTRIHDVNSFTRTKTLQQLTAIVRSRSIKEAAQYVDTLKAAQDRLMDKTAAVRKAAIQLLTALMEMNPFAPLLQLELFQKKLNEKMEEFRAQLEKQHALMANHRAGAAQQPGGEEDDEAEPGAMEVDEEDEDGEEQKEKMADERKEDAHTSSKSSSAPTEHSVKALLSSSTLSDLTLDRLRSQVDTLFHGVRFIHTLHEEIMPVLHEMFLSKTQSDAIECINFFVVAKEFGLSAPPAAEVAEQGEEGAAAAVHAPPRKLVTVDSGCKKMAGLIWSREPTVRDAVLAAFTRLYLNDELHSRSGPVAKKAALLSIQSLLSIVLSSNLSELTSLEEICTKLYYAGSIPSILIDSLWELFASEKLDEAAIKQAGSHTRAAVLTLINFFSNASGFVLSNHVEELVSVGFSGAAISTSPTLVRAACISLQKWNAAIKNAPSHREAPPAISEKTLAVIFQRMEVLLLNSQVAPPVVYKRGSNSVSSVASAWYSMVEQVLNSIFQLHSTPERFCEKVLHSLMRTLFTPADPSDPSMGGAAALGTGEKLARFLFLLAHVAMRTLVHLEALEKDIKNLKAKRNAAPQIETERIGVDEEDEEEEEETKPTRAKAKKKAAPKKAAASKRKKKRADSDEESEEEVSEEEEEESEEEEPVKKASKKRAAAKKSSTAVSSTPVEAPSSLEVELGSYAEAEHELEKLREATEARLIEVRADATGMLSVFAPIVERIVMTLIPGSAQYGRFAAHPTLQVNAVLALSKLMCLHVSYCEAHLTLLFSVLRAPTTSSTIKANIIIALGDLFLRFPNSIEPYSEHMYHGLKKQVRPVVVNKKKGSVSSSSASESVTQRAVLDEMFVRKNTLMVLTHLILNDMLKAKGPIAEIAKATQDFHTQPRIAQLAKAFFQELNNKSGDSKATIYNILPDILSRLSNESGASSVSQSEFQQIFKFLLGFLTKDKQIENLIEKLLHRFELVYVDPVAKVAEQLDNLEVGAEAEQEVKVKKEGGEEEQAVQKLPSLKSTGVPLTSQDVSLKQCRDLSYCLTQLPFSLTSLKKLHSLYRCYASKLGDAETFDNFMAILTKVRKNLANVIKEGAGVNMASTNKEKEAVEAKQLCDELEAKWNEQYEKLMEEAATTSKARHARGKKGYGEKIHGEEEEEEEKKHMDTDEEDAPAPSARGGRRLASKAAAPAPSKSRRGGVVAAKKAAAPAKSTSSSRRKKVESSSEDEEDSEEEEEDDDESVDEVSEEEEEEEVKPKRGGKKAAPAPKKAPAKAASRSRRRIVDSDEDDDDE